MSNKYILKQIPPEDIDFAESNPRGEKPEEIEADPEFEQLKDSVFKYGVLVPIVVHAQGKRFRLVDGERRLRAALATKVKRIPAHIATGKPGLDDLVEAFHIHMLRKQWRAVAQAKALKKIIEGLRAQGNFDKESDSLDALQEITGCTEHRLKSLRRAIRFPESVLRMVDAGNLNFSHLVQIEESFIEAINMKFPGLLREIGDKHARQVLVLKAQQKTLTSTRALMEHVLPVITRAETNAERSFARQLLKEFIEQIDMPAEKVLQRYEERFPTSGRDWVELGEKVLNFAEWLGQLLDNVDTEMARGHPKLTEEVKQKLRSLRTQIGTVIRRINRVEE